MFDIVRTIGDPAPIPVPPELEAFAEAIPGIVGALRDSRVVGETSGSLDEREIELIRVGTLVALGAPIASFRAHVARAVQAGATRQDVWSAVASVVTLVGVPRLLEAVPMISESLDAADK